MILLLLGVPCRMGFVSRLVSVAMVAAVLVSWLPMIMADGKYHMSK